MEILYIWIREYGPFRYQGFQLSGELIFDFNRTSGVLSVNRNHNYVAGFFRDRMAPNEMSSVVTNISALVGDNGSGKTTLLNFIKHYLVRAMGNDIKEALAVLRNENGETIVLYDKSVIDLNAIEHNGLLHKTKIFCGQHRYKELPDSSVIYFSNIFDNSMEREADNYYNLSTNYLIRGDQKRRLDYQNGDPKQCSIDAHRDEDMQRQVFFVYDYPFRFPEQELSVKLPTMLVVKIRNIENEDHRLLGRLASFYEDFNDYVVNMMDEVSRNFNKKSARSEGLKRKFMLVALRAMVYSFFKEISTFNDVVLLENDDPILSISDVRSEKEPLFNYVKRLFNEIMSRTDDKFIKEWISHLIIMVDYFPSYLNYTYYLSEQYCIKLPIMRDAIMKSPSYDLVQVYRRSYRLFPYLDFEWPLSSGERAFLNVFSRLYSRDDGEVFGNNVKLTKYVLLMIDEGELYFHPEWQRHFIDTLIRFLSVVYGPERKVQILLTSHSPFVLSDLPGYNVTYLERRGRWTTALNGPNTEFSTFAANIHDLLVGGFFLKANIGEFALHKLNDAISRLKYFQDDISAKSSPSFASGIDEIEYLRSIIRLVGEPIIAGRMLELLDGIEKKPGVNKHD